MKSFDDAKQLCTYQILHKLNKTQMRLYRYTVSHLETVYYMTVREFAAKLAVSPSTVMRFCYTLGFDRYDTFKQAIQHTIQTQNTQTLSADINTLVTFLQQANTPSFTEKMEQAVRLLSSAEQLLFAGGGSSGALARYGARCFSNRGKLAVGLEDTCYPAQIYQLSHTVLITLSVSGETEFLIELASRFQQAGCPLLSITGTACSTLAKMSDWNLSYNIEPDTLYGGYNSATQVPALFILEQLAKQLCSTARKH